MIPEIVGAITALKEALNLVSTASEMKKDFDLKSFTTELNNKLAQSSVELANVSAMYASHQISNMEKDEELRKLKMFIEKISEYEAYTTDAGSFVYKNKITADENVKPHYICPNCYHKQIVSILQPMVKDVFVTNFGDYVFQMKCPQCNTELLMDKSRLDSKTRSNNRNQVIDKLAGSNRGGGAW